MPPGPGYWYNPQTDRLFKIGMITHDDWLRDPANAEQLGVSSETHRAVARSRNIDLIRLAATMEGMIRIRDNHTFISVQFYAERVDAGILDKIYQVLTSQNLDEAARLEIGNLRTGESFTLSIGELRTKTLGNQVLFAKEVSLSEPSNIPDHPLAAQVKKRKMQAQTTGEYVEDL